MCGPNFCSMKISQDVQEYAKSRGFSDDQALKDGMKDKAIEFINSGAKVYRKI